MSLEQKKKQTQGEGHVTTEAEIGLMLPETKEDLEPSEIKRGKEGFSPKGFGAIANIEFCPQVLFL